MKSTTSHNVTIELIRGDIANQEDIDAVVNAANASLSGGGGVDGALHRAAGPELVRESRPLGPIKPGEAVVTGGYHLPNRFVIHCLGPVYGQDKPEKELLANCYKNALKLAEQNKVERIAFPSISTGAFGYPMTEAASIALKTIRDATSGLSRVRLIRFVLWGEEALDIHEEAMEKVFG